METASNLQIVLRNWCRIFSFRRTNLCNEIRLMDLRWLQSWPKVCVRACGQKPYNKCLTIRVKIRFSILSFFSPLYFLLTLKHRTKLARHRHRDEVASTNIIELGIDLSEFYLSVEWDILEVREKQKYSYHCFLLSFIALQFCFHFTGSSDTKRKILHMLRRTVHWHYV